MKKLFLITYCFYSLQIFSQGTITVPLGTNIKGNGSANIVLSDMHLVNNGSVSQSATGIFKCTGNINTIISGSGTISVDNMIIDKGSGKLSLQQNISLASQLSFSTGLLDLANNNIVLGNGAVLSGESETSHSITTGTGYIQADAILNAPSSVNIGNLGAVITSSSNLGSTIIRRGNKSQQNSFGNGNSIFRYYIITPTNNTALNATLRINYLTAELNGLDPNTLTTWKQVAGNWTNMGFSSRNTVSNYVEQTGLADFSTWTLSSIGNALPVSFLLLNSLCNGATVTLNWKTSTEVNTSDFGIEKSIDGRNWNEIGIVPAFGNTTTEHSYSFKDIAGSNNGNLYRIAETDISGKKTFSTIIKSSCAGNEQFLVYPNPVKNLALVTIFSEGSQDVKLLVTDAKGSLVLQKQTTILAGTNQLQVDMSRLTPGNYTLVAEWEGNKKAMKLVKD